MVQLGIRWHCSPVVKCLSWHCHQIDDPDYTTFEVLWWCSVYDLYILCKHTFIKPTYDDDVYYRQFFTLCSAAASLRTCSTSLKYIVPKSQPIYFPWVHLFGFQLFLYADCKVHPHHTLCHSNHPTLPDSTPHLKLCHSNQSSVAFSWCLNEKPTLPKHLICSQTGISPTTGSSCE